MPLLRVERGDPTEEELAAVVAVLAARLASAGGTGTSAPRRSEWANPARSLRRPHQHGPAGWRAAVSPR
jgi:hypothetical protein